MSAGLVRVVLPAAGRSARMGRVDKRLLPWGGDCLLASAVRRASTLDPEPIVVLRSEDRSVREMLAGVAYLPVLNPDPERGPVSSVAQGGMAALERGATGIVVVLPDMPCVSHLTIARVMEAFQKTGGDSVVSCDYGGTPAPPVALPARVLRALSRRTGSVRDALDRMGEVRQTVPAPREELVDVDTPRDWLELSPP